ncbi:hypothetical protein [uncultured Clostridium sp.]|uniref:hypothetical protein n=1 Tax=uncultured Clostridium sp. TaxID=59620 RepID=UPI0028EA9D37|nr:hypothetical protein [uncultured Clostridium sp.]
MAREKVIDFERERSIKELKKMIKNLSWDFYEIRKIDFHDWPTSVIKATIDNMKDEK